MVFLYLLALIGLGTLIALSILAVVIAGRRVSDDPFDQALTAVARLQSAAWRSVQELRALDADEKGEQ